MVLEWFAYHDPRVDKNGREVSRFIRDAVEAFREENHNLIAMCHNAQTGLIQYYSVKPEVFGDTVRLARGQGYELKLAMSKNIRVGDGPEKRRGYAEFVPADLDPDVTDLDGYRTCG